MSSESTLSAKDLHEVLVQAARVARVAKRKFLRAFAVMALSRFYLALGFPSIESYAGRYFGLSRAIIHEYLRVEEALGGLPAIERAFSEGRVAWTVVREVTRVATAESEPRPFADSPWCRAVETIHA